MTDEQRKEMMSREFIKILANAHGFKVTESPMDHGVDLTIVPVTERILPGGQRRFLDSQYKLDFQVKSTTPAGVTENPLEIKYDLEVKTYNDLVARRIEDLPLHLVLVVLREAPPLCVEIDDARILLGGRAFWYLPELDAEPTENTATIRVTIPKTNIVGHAFVRERYDGLGIEL